MTSPPEWTPENCNHSSASSWRQVCGKPGGGNTRGNSLSGRLCDTDTWATRVLRRTRQNRSVCAGEEAVGGVGVGSRVTVQAGGGGGDVCMGHACPSGFQNKNLMEKIIEMKVRAY